MTDISKELQKLKSLINQRQTTAIFSNKSNESTKLSLGDAELYINDMTRKFCFIRSGVKNPIMIDAKNKSIENVEYINEIKVENISKTINDIKQLQEVSKEHEQLISNLEAEDIALNDRINTHSHSAIRNDLVIDGNVNVSKDLVVTGTITSETINEIDEQLIDHEERIVSIEHSKIENIDNDLTVNGNVNVRDKVLIGNTGVIGGPYDDTVYIANNNNSSVDGVTMLSLHKDGFTFNGGSVGINNSLTVMGDINGVNVRSMNENIDIVRSITTEHDNILEELSVKDSEIVNEMHENIVILTSKDSELDTKIDTEISERKAADTELNNKIIALENNTYDVSQQVGSHTHSTINNDLTVNGTMNISGGKVEFTNTESNELIMPMATNDCFRIKTYNASGTSDNGIVEFATDDNGNEGFYFRQYNSGSMGTDKEIFTNLKRELCLLDSSGNSHIPGIVTIRGNEGGTALELLSNKAKTDFVRLKIGVDRDDTNKHAILGFGNLDATPYFYIKHGGTSCSYVLERNHARVDGGPFTIRDGDFTANKNAIVKGNCTISGILEAPVITEINNRLLEVDGTISDIRELGILHASSISGHELRLEAIEDQDVVRDSRVTVLEANCTENINKITELEASDVEINNKVTELQSNLASINSNVTGLEASHTLHSNKITILQNSNSEYDTRISTLESGVESINNKVTELIASDVEINNNITVLQSDVESINSNITVLQSDVESINNNITVLEGHTHSTISNDLTVDGVVNISGNKIEFTNKSTENQLKMYMADTDCFRLRAYGSSNNGTVEFATDDDGSEGFYFRQYSGGGVGQFKTVKRELCLLDGSGNTTIPGSLTIKSPTYKPLKIFDSSMYVNDPYTRVCIGKSESECAYYGYGAPKEGDPTLAFMTLEGGKAQISVYTDKINLIGGPVNVLDGDFTANKNAIVKGNCTVDGSISSPTITALNDNIATINSTLDVMSSDVNTNISGLTALSADIQELQQKDAEIAGTINTLQQKDAELAESLQESADYLEAKIIEHDSSIKTLENKDTEITRKINSLEQKDAEQDTRITAAEAAITSAEAAIQEVQGVTQEHSSRIDVLESKTIDIVKAGTAETDDYEFVDVKVKSAARNAYVKSATGVRNTLATVTAADITYDLAVGDTTATITFNPPIPESAFIKGFTTQSFVIVVYDSSKLSIVCNTEGEVPVWSGADNISYSNGQLTFDKPVYNERFYILSVMLNKYIAPFQTTIQENYLRDANIVSAIVDLIYPVGSLYTSFENISPARRFGGRWTQIVDRFLYCAENSMETGGSKQITTAQLPSHSHGIKSLYDDFNYNTGNNTTADMTYNSIPWDNNTNGNYTYSRVTYTEDAGRGEDYMPPYITIYAWRRIA